MSFIFFGMEYLQNSIHSSSEQAMEKLIEAQGFLMEVWHCFVSLYRIVRFVIENTIEERILKLQEKKELVFEG